MASRCRFSSLAVVSCAVAFGPLLLSSASARVIYVSRNSAVPTPDGASWDTAYTSIQAAAAAAAEGDEIWVTKGTYREAITISKGGVGLYGGFAGSESARDQRDPNANVSQISVGWLRTSAAASSAPITISGFTLVNCASGLTLNSPAANVSDNVITACSGSSSGIAIAIHGTVTVRNTVITGNWTGSSGTVFVFADGNATITGCIISENQAIQGAGIYVQGTATITDNLIDGNATYSQGGGIYVGPAAIATIANNTLVGNSTSSGDGAGLFVDGVATVVNNIVAFNDTGFGTSVTSSVLKNNDVYGNTDWDYRGIADPTTTNGNISADPLFVNDGDYHVQGESPCVDAGDDGYVSQGASDFDGNPRILGSHVDIGAYERPGAIRFTMQDVAQALRIAGGLEGSSQADLTLLNVANEGASVNAVDCLDAVRIARKVAGLEPNP